MKVIDSACSMIYFCGEGDSNITCDCGALSVVQSEEWEAGGGGGLAPEAPDRHTSNQRMRPRRLIFPAHSGAGTAFIRTGPFWQQSRDPIRSFRAKSLASIENRSLWFVRVCEGPCTPNLLPALPVGGTMQPERRATCRTCCHP